MTALTGLLRSLPAESFWGRFQPSIDLEPHQAIFFLTEKQHALRRVEVSGGEGKSVLAEPDCHGLIVARDFGVRLTAPCHFEGGLAGEVEAEVRLRCLDNAAEWPRWIAGGTAASTEHSTVTAEQSLARLVAGLFEAELTRSFAAESYREVSHRLNDPTLVAQVEARVRSALSRWTDERVVGLSAVHLLKIHSTEGESHERSELEAAQEQARLEREHRLRILAAKQAAELAALKPAAPPSSERPDYSSASSQIQYRPKPPAGPSVAERHESIARVLSSLGSAQPATVMVRLLAWTKNQPGGVAEALRTSPEGSRGLHIGDEIHVVVQPPVAGFLHVFNLGSSGEVSLLIPAGDASPVKVEAHQPYLVSTDGPVAAVTAEEPPMSPWIEEGPVNGYAERILAVVTASSAPLPACELHAAWSGAPTARPSAVGFGAPQIEATLAARPPALWAWGLAEVTVQA
jgi:hypothetical protein